MGTIRSALFISLDGVVEAPDTWHFPYFNEEMGAAVGELMQGNDATLLGRQTYDEFASFWPTADPADPFTKQMNEGKKYVVSGTLTDPTWQNSFLVSGDVRGRIAELKKSENLASTGSGTLVRWLLEQDLVDELHLFVHPIVVGKGRRLFPDGETIRLALSSANTFSTGVVHLTYTGAERQVP